MAVVSISRIQIRRGRRTELPQLASGEFGWAVDSQEIFIGNGAVSEGAPYVGNTKLLTEHDDLFQLASQYTYKNGSTIQTGPTANSPIERTLQARLDEIVNLSSFGGIGDGTDHTSTIQRALDHLYLGASTKNTETARVVLYVQPGVYEVSSTIYIPPFASIVGSGIDKTIFSASASLSGPMFRTQNDLGSPGVIGDRDLTTTLNQSRNIKFSDFTMLTREQTGIMLDSCRDSVFSNIEIAGNWTTTNPTNVNDIAIQLIAKSTAVTTKENYFNGVQIRNKRKAIVSDDDITNNRFENCSFNECLKGFDLGAETILGQLGQNIGPSHTIIQNSEFQTISQEAIIITTGRFNQSNNNRFFNVGNNNGSPDNAQFPVINFLSDFNQSNDDWFERSIDLGYNLTYQEVVYPPEVQGSVITDMRYTHQLEIGYSPTPTKIIGFAADTRKTIIVDYIYKSLTVDVTRNGKLTITINPTTNDYQISDEFDYIGLIDAISPYEERVEFSLSLADYDSDLTVDTVDLSVLNLTTLNDNAVIKYRISVKS